MRAGRVWEAARYERINDGASGRSRHAVSLRMVRITMACREWPFCGAVITAPYIGCAGSCATGLQMWRVKDAARYDLRRALRTNTQCRPHRQIGISLTFSLKPLILLGFSVFFNSTVMYFPLFLPL